MLVDLVWEKENPRCKIQIVRDLRKTDRGQYYWKGGIPKNPDIPKCLVKIYDKALQDEYFPTDAEFDLVHDMLDADSRGILAEAFRVKEMLNVQNLKNPEVRKKEAIFSRLCK